MIPEVREWFNSQFSEEKYQQLIQYLEDWYQTPISFRIAESPFFIPSILKQRLLDACHEISSFILDPEFKNHTQEALMNAEIIVPGEDEHTLFLQMDFGVCLDQHGDPFPQLIEIQGFPSVYFFQWMIGQAYRKVYDIPENLTSYFKDISSEQYRDMLRTIIVGEDDPRHVVILEIEPEKQTTYIDMLSTSRELNIPCVCVTEVFKAGNKLYYKDSSGQDTEIRKIYNRVIFDELLSRKDLKLSFDFKDELDVEWIGHPNWFYRISKFCLPLLKSGYVPDTFFLKDLSVWPEDLENYVLKPLYSFAGSGVVIDLQPEDLDSISDPENYILQKKVEYAPVIKSPDDSVKCEIRMLMLWPKGADKPEIVNNLVRMSKGKMVGVKYNRDKTWVGGSVGFFEK
jgi:hypothetical protein